MDTDRSRAAEPAKPAPPRSLGVFLLLAFAITWAVWVPRALASHGLLEAAWADTLGSFWSYGPLLAALVAAAVTGGQAAVRTWGERLVRWRVGYLPYAVALLGPAVFWLAVAAAAVLFGQPWAVMQPRILQDGPVLGVALLGALLLTDGLGEEAGWRGSALPELLERVRPLLASLFLGVVWAVWHLPLIFTKRAAMDGTPFVFLLLDLPASAVLFTWLFLRSRGSVLPAVLLHAGNNAWTAVALPAGTPAQLVVVVAVKWLLVLGVVAVWGPGLVQDARPARAPVPT
jgi:membrane protease YdiL (CAAX protease family)